MFKTIVRQFSVLALWCISLVFIGLMTRASVALFMFGWNLFHVR